MKSGHDIRYRLFLICGMLAPVVLAVVVIIVGNLTPDYNQVSDTISLMGVPGRPYAWLLNCGYSTYGLMMALAAYGLSRTIDSTPLGKKLAVLLGIHAFGTVLLAVFPDSTTSHVDEMVHNVMSATSYLPLIAGIYISRPLSRHELSLKAAGVLGVFIIIINIPLPFVHMVEPLASIGGLLQRTLSLCSYLWITLVFFLLYRNRDSIRLKVTDTKILKSPILTEHIQTNYS